MKSSPMTRPILIAALLLGMAAGAQAQAQGLVQCDGNGVLHVDNIYFDNAYSADAGYEIWTNDPSRARVGGHLFQCQKPVWDR